MARMTEFQPLYDAFRMFRERCLQQDSSLLWPDQNLWTLSNLERWKSQVIDNPNVGEGTNFNVRLEHQLIGAPQVLWGIAADLHYVYYLPSANIKFDTRLNNINWAAKHAGLTIPTAQDPIWEAYKKGFTRTGQRYHFRYAQLQLLIMFALKFKEEGKPIQILSNPNHVQTLLDEILETILSKGDRAYDMRHAILYLMFPDDYERIISTRDKERIIERYGTLISDEQADLDDKLRQIRRSLSKTLPEGADFDYFTHLRYEWRLNEPRSTRQIQDEETIEYTQMEIKIISDGLRLLKRFKNLILFGPPGTGKTYWADKIAKQLITPQLKQTQSRGTFFQTIIEGLSFYDALALGMYANNPDKKYSVLELEVFEIVQARFRQNPVKHPKNQIWGYLQSHTSPESQTVRLSSRAEPYLFDKTQESSWFLTNEGKEYVVGTLPDQLNLIKQGPPASNQPQDFIKWITFHQSYAYEDFVEGLRPKSDPSDTGGLSFEMKSGIFRSLCSRAQDDPDNHYVLVIDEINRGNIAKVFGELMTLIEADKRDILSVELPYSKDTFQVPANLAIIGTMNTADRSIALLDVALRRRFAFLELLPEPELLDSIIISVTEEDPLNLGKCLRVLNQRISEMRGKDYQIGHSYFLPIKEISTDDEKLACLDDIWNYQVMPLLKEYFYSQGDLLCQAAPGFFDEDNSDQDKLAISPIVLHAEELVSALNKL